MDNLPYLIMSRRDADFFSIFKDVMILVVLLPVLKHLIDKASKNLKKYNFGRSNKKYSSIEFIGHETLIDNSTPFFDYPEPMTAICHYIGKKHKNLNLKYFNIEKNGYYYYDDVPKSQKNDTLNYLVNQGKDILIEDDIYFDFEVDDVTCKTKDKEIPISKIHLIIKSDKKNTDELNLFIEKTQKLFSQYQNDKNKNKIFHFIYQKRENSGKMVFSKNILSVTDNAKFKNYETFDNIFSENKEKIIKDINRLKDISYYERTGCKRKKGYLFYGPPGCGKTSSVIAMANYDNRHIIEVSMSRLKTNQELEELFSLTEIQGVKITKDNVILLFDEIDTGLDCLQKRKTEAVAPKKVEKSKKTNADVDSSDSESDSDSESEDEKSNVSNTISYHSQDADTQLQRESMLLRMLSTQNKDDEFSSFSKTESDKINLGSILSRFDGVGSYNGLIIVATTNCRDRLSPALYRHGRLNPVYFSHMRNQDIKNMIEAYFARTLTDEEVEMLPDVKNKITPASMRKYIEDFDDDFDGFFKFVSSLKD